MKILVPILLLALFAGSALAAPLAKLRTEVQSTDAAMDRALLARAALAERHEALAAEIGVLKAKPTLFPGLRGGSLDNKLKAAHALSDALATKDREVEAAEAAVDAARAALMSALDRSIAQQRAALSTAAPEARTTAFAALNTLVMERGTLGAAAAPARTARVELPGISDESADDLRDLADETDDHADKVKSALSALEDRLESLRARRRMLRSANAFRRDDALFAEDERNRTVVRSDRPTAGDATARPKDEGTTRAASGGDVVDADSDGIEASSDDAPAAGGGDPAPPNDFQDGAEEAPDPDGAPGGDRGNGLGAAAEFETFDPAVPVPSSGVVTEVNLGQSFVVEDALDPALLSGDIGDLSPEALADHIRAVEAQRAQLSKTARDLARRKDALERKARELDP